MGGPTCNFCEFVASQMSHVVRKWDYCPRGKGADKLCSNCTAEQCLCFHYMDRTIPLLPKSKISVFEEVEGAYWFGSVRPVVSSGVQSVCDA